MSAYFEGALQTKPPIGYGWLSDFEKRKRVINLLKRGYNDPWMQSEIERLQIEDYEYTK